MNVLVPLKARESSIKELPTKPIQVNSATKLPHIRNQHVNPHVDVHKVKSEEQQYINNLSSGVRRDYKHTLPNGESIDIDLCIDIQKSRDGKSYQDTNFASYVSKESMGYIQGSDRQNMKLSKKFFDDLGMNTLLKSLDIEDISNYEGFELDLYINRKKTDEHGFMADLRLKRSEKRVDDDIVSASFSITDSNVNNRIEADLDYIEVSSEHEPRLGITLQAEFMRSLKKHSSEER